MPYFRYRRKAPADHYVTHIWRTLQSALRPAFRRSCAPLPIVYVDSGCPHLVKRGRRGPSPAPLDQRGRLTAPVLFFLWPCKRVWIVNPRNSITWFLATLGIFSCFWVVSRTYLNFHQALRRSVFRTAPSFYQDPINCSPQDNPITRECSLTKENVNGTSYNLAKVMGSAVRAVQSCIVFFSLSNPPFVVWGRPNS
jgi:hypothetical protein